MPRPLILACLSVVHLSACGLGLRPRLGPEDGSVPLTADEGTPPTSNSASTPNVSATDGGFVSTADAGVNPLLEVDPCEKGKVLCRGQCVGAELMLPECEPKWVEVKTTYSPMSASGYPVFYDAERKELMLKTKTALFRFAGDTWTRVSSEGPNVINMRAAFDSQRRKTFIFGAAENGESSWEWNDGSWTRRENGPGGDDDFAMTFDSARKRVVAVGRLWGPPGVQKFWEWDNLSWKGSSVPVTLRADYGMGVAYDVARKQVVLFGGHYRYHSLFESDTWIWDGSQWEKKRPTRTPNGRRGAAMAYDLHRHRVVLFGGEVNSSGDSSDVWEWDGENWLQKLPSGGPSKRRFANFVYDLHRQRFVLHGGGPSGTGSVAHMNDMWELVFP